RIGFNRVPQEMRDRPQWVVWRYVLNKERTKWTKLLFNARSPNSVASSTDPETWSTFETAEATFYAMRENPGDDRIDGVGYVFDGADPFVGIDLDHSLNLSRDTKKWVGVKPWASDYLDLLNS